MSPLFVLTKENCAPRFVLAIHIASLRFQKVFHRSSAIHLDTEFPVQFLAFPVLIALSCFVIGTWYG
jgi:hypothetical protein